ncbi:Znfinger in Ran binding protein and others domain containing protein [Acanthamoeba castellanii str. Neff]|uniref:Znfinger in Ran binding protein and others domain containing protein n=1 Tax=Acanthamoeba castellanii (strain ATCC 30010 / Neff) TaxID=1257118 RepID=L8GP74_ACACF|nr:Znfinger in Ran binding protein and others domain containing protein [Acanthamoeba castellanii str. Neff]ELR14448.1 Znfinger in Ran binding protein and others domain containing protein [Acanthamoeba castellanii str. Neff]
MNKTMSVPRKPGDWDCPNAACAEINFGSRVACRKCAAPRPQAAATNATTNAMSVPRKPGDWDCPNAACAEDDDEEGGVSTTTPGLVRLEVGPMWGASSIHVTGALGGDGGPFQRPGLGGRQRSWGTTAHINLKGSPASILNSHVDLFNGWVLL